MILLLRIVRWVVGFLVITNGAGLLNLLLAKSFVAAGVQTVFFGLLLAAFFGLRKWIIRIYERRHGEPPPFLKGEYHL